HNTKCILYCTSPPGIEKETGSWNEVKEMNYLPSSLYLPVYEPTLLLTRCFSWCNRCLDDTG
ncbi:MAG TPA: hypothetical protein PLN30_10320, partial [Ferruginibacter sp.]|nr:hypothetical protein [Ferruginibacter sp.]